MNNNFSERMNNIKKLNQKAEVLIDNLLNVYKKEREFKLIDFDEKMNKNFEITEINVNNVIFYLNKKNFDFLPKG
jgi:hypothetical protein